MTDRVISLRPRSSSASSPRIRPVPDGVRVEWDGVRGLHIAVCDRCWETFTSLRFAEAHEWADTHTCDGELAALLADITRRPTRRAA